MPDLTIKGLDDSALRTITFQAEVQNRSVDDVVIGLIRLGLLHDIDGRVAVADRIRSRSKPSSEDSTDIIRRMRDAV